MIAREAKTIVLDCISFTLYYNLIHKLVHNIYTRVI
jgi:hypothetical protein